MKKDSFLGKLVYGYDKLEEYVLCASLLLTTLIIFVQVIMRSVFNSSLTWSEELTRYIFIWQIWMGVSIAQKDKAHIKVEILKSFVKNQKVIAVVDVIATILLIAFNIFLVTSRRRAGAADDLPRQCVQRHAYAHVDRLHRAAPGLWHLHPAADRPGGPGHQGLFGHGSDNDKEVA